jgi:flagellar basal-body rod protein FlgB
VRPASTRIERKNRVCLSDWIATPARILDSELPPMAAHHVRRGATGEPTMLDKLASALDFDRQALGLRFERQKVLAGNIANADTPNFKARDFDFSKALAQATARGSQGQLAMTTTSTGHLQGGGESVGTAPRMLYRVPDQPSLDGNTVNMDVERAAFADNTVRYETSLTLINNRLRNLKAAMQPE